MSEYHTPVLLGESIDLLDIQENGVYVDATFGGGGHSAEILSRLGPEGTLLAFDKDADAFAHAPADARLHTVRNNFRYVHNFVRQMGYTHVDGIIADLGVSSHQFDTPERGFSFRFDAELDMRMNDRSELTAVTVLNTYTQENLEKIFRLYGEVEGSGRAAALICRARENSPIRTTGDLQEAIRPLLPRNAEHKFLAKIYQALRIEVNGEMRDLEGFLKGAAKALRCGGVLSVITYHSLEDRIVKNFFRAGNREGIAEKDPMGRTAVPWSVITRKPILPTEAEISANTRARSAKLRAARRTGSLTA